MILEVKERVRAILGELAVPVPEERVHLLKDALGRQKPMPCVVLVATGEKTEPAGDIVDVETDLEAKVRRYVRRRAKRLLDVTMVVQAHTEREADAILEGVVDRLMDGFLVGGRRVEVHRSDTSWVDDESVKRKEPEALVGLRFEGGIYRTKVVPLLTDILVESEVM